MTNHIFKHPYSREVSSFRYDQRHLYNVARRQRRRMLKIVAEIEQALESGVFSLTEVHEMRQTIAALTQQDDMLSELQAKIGTYYVRLQEQIIHALNLCDPNFGEFPTQLRTHKFPSPVVPPKKGEPL